MGSIRSSGEEVVVTIDVHEAKDLIKSGYGYLDVRTVEEFNKGHVDAPKIFNIPFMFNTPQGRVNNPEFLKEVSFACDNEDRLIVGCQSGVRSLSATADLLKNGYKHVSNMGGGYLAWVENGFPIKKPEDELPIKKPEDELPIKKPEDELPIKKPEEELPIKKPEDELPIKKPEEEL